MGSAVWFGLVGVVRQITVKSFARLLLEGGQARLALTFLILFSLTTLGYSQTPSLEEHLVLDIPAFVGDKPLPESERVKLNLNEQAALEAEVARRFSGPEGLLTETTFRNENDLYRMANYLFFKKDWAKAQTLFGLMLKRYPGGRHVDQAHFFLGEVYLHQGRHEEALKEYDLIRRRFPTSRIADEAILSTGWANLLTKKYGQAYESAQRLQIHFPKSELIPAALLLAALAKAGVRQYSDALGNLGKLIRQSAGTFDRARAYYLMAYLYFAAERTGEGNRYVALMEKEYPSHELLPKVIFQGALFSYHRREHSQVDFLLGKLLASSQSVPFEAQALYLAVRSLVGQDKISPAQQFYARLSKGYFGSVWEKEAFDVLLSGYQRSSAWQMRKEAHVRFLELGVRLEEREGTYLKLAEEFYLMGDYGLAAGAFEDFLKSAQDKGKVKSALFSLGESLFQLKRYEAAQGPWARLLSSFPDMEGKDRVLLRLGEAAQKEGDQTKAVDYLNRVASGEPTYMEARWKMAGIYFQQRTWAKAVALSQELMEGYPEAKSRPELYFNLGQAYFQLGDYGKSFDYLALAYARFPLAREIDRGLYFMGEAHRERGRKDLAALFYEIVAGSHPDSPYREKSFYRLGEAYFSQGEWLRTAMALGELYRQFPGSEFLAESLLKLGHAYFNLGKYLQATFYYLKVLSERPGATQAPAAEYGIISSFYRRGKHEEFIERAKRFLEQYPKTSLAAEVELILGRYYHDQGELDKAGSYYESLASWQPNDVALLRLGQVYQARGEYAKAASAFQKVMADFPDSPLVADGRYGLGLAYFQGKEFARAIAVFNEIMVTDPQGRFVRDAFYLSGESCRLLKNYPCAKLRLAEYASRFPEDILRFRVNLDLGLIFMEERNYAAAAPLLKDAAGSPDRALATSALLSAGRAYLLLGKEGEAEAALDKVLGFMPTYREEVEAALLMKGELYMKQRRWEEAANAYKRVLKESKLERARLLSSEKLKEIELLKREG